MFKTVTFEVIGEQTLHCDNCERRVERMLKPLSGVIKVRAESKNQKIEVLFDDASLTAAGIVDVLDNAGYQTKIEGAS